MENIKQNREESAQVKAVVVAPPVDVYENADELLLLADLPGVALEDLTLNLDKTRLELEARQRTSGEVAPKLFQRTFRIPDTLDPNRVEAELRAGVLHLHLKKSEASRPRRINISAS
jgi:HSP20 family protein